MCQHIPWILVETRPGCCVWHHRLKLFKWHQHKEGKLRCIRGLVSDISMDKGDRLEELSPEILDGLFREAQEKRDPEEVIQLAQTLSQAGVNLDRFQQVDLSAEQSLQAPTAMQEDVIEARCTSSKPDAL